ncbi:MAG: glycosyltransferase [Pseudomonadota bacterium]
MKVVFASHGSLGDLVPFLEIGRILNADGHTVVIATHDAHRAAVEEAGLTHAPMRPDRPNDPEFHARFMAPMRGASFVFNHFLIPAIEQSDADLMRACQGADVLVSVTLALAAPLVAARTGIPWRSAVFQPSMLFSIHDPPKVGMLPMVPGAPRFNAYILRKAKGRVERWAKPLRRYRRSQGLGEYPDHPAFGGQISPDGVLALYSPLFGTLPPDAPPGTIQTGQVLQTGGPPLPADLAAFLTEGPPPVVFTLGSASAHAARSFFQDSARIAEEVGVRALLLVGRDENLKGLPETSDNFLARPTAPYHAVFAHASAVVHQGGIGTIALAVAASVPMVVVPFAHDQPDNAARAVRAGVAVELTRRGYARKGAQALSTVRTDARMAETLREAATTIRFEKGAERAAAEILRAAQVR